MIERRCDKCGELIRGRYYRIDVSPVADNGLHTPEKDYYIDLCEYCHEAFYNNMAKYTIAAHARRDK